jgi:RNA polymerase sigma factor (sigma-70 family)
LTRLLDAHGDRLYATLLRLTLRRAVAAELLQELFVRLSRADGAFDQARDPAAYAGRAAINLAMEWRRRRRSDLLATSTAISNEIDIAAPNASPLQRLIDAERFERLLAALPELSEASREAFVLRFIEGLSYAQVATRLERTPHQARGLCHAAVRQLREKLEPASARRS